jgi:hypothetical protein
VQALREVVAVKLKTRGKVQEARGGRKTPTLRDAKRKAAAQGKVQEPAEERLFPPIPIFRELDEDREGRPRKPITRQIIETMCKVLRAAGTLEGAAVAAGISPRHFFSWKADVLRRAARAEATLEEMQFLQALEDAGTVSGLNVEVNLIRLSRRNPALALAVAERHPKTREKWRPPRVDVLVRSELELALVRLKKAFLPHDPENYERAVAAIAGELGEDRAGGNAPGEGGPDHPAGGEAVQSAPASSEAGGVAPP